MNIYQYMDIYPYQTYLYTYNKPNIKGKSFFKTLGVFIGEKQKINIL